MDTVCILFLSSQWTEGCFAGMVVIFRGKPEEGVILGEGLRVGEDPADGMFPELLWRG